MRAKTQLYPTIKKPVVANRCLPVQYTQNFKPSSSIKYNNVVEAVDRVGSTVIVSLPKSQHTTIDSVIKVKANEQKEKLLKELELENINATEILLRVSQCFTPYANLLKLAYEELQYATAPTHSAQFEELERTAALTSARQEVDVQQAEDRVARLKTEGNELKKNLRRHQNRLNSINKDIDRLNQLTQLHGIENSDEVQSKQHVIDDDDGISAAEKIPLDDNLYKELWAEHSSLNNQIEELEKVLKETQERQADAFHETAMRIIQRKSRSSI
ncbi:hypothetical protein TRFO_14992 [Tritrichomonas foetus]|uniref:Uncharacterized protein n=1 Tax=Tritrichomonas foetus TaxID=1144522 RepID=A0A1J4KTK4_9EUKA|nr:hypothetical protein TRFO_14992 [Tritrichomonas foetus]|eukprot:OHT14587.1 hypothetical protein TRFO_14992 [Tritrichomonas foetus]